MELRIDNRKCDLGPECRVAWSWESRQMCDLESLREGWSVKLSLPATANNDSIMGYPLIPNSQPKFNNDLHSAQLTKGAETIFKGVVRLLGVESRGGLEHFDIEIRGGADGWAKSAATQSLKELGIEFSMPLTLPNIALTWRSASVVKFLPIIYDDYSYDVENMSTMPQQKILSTDNYHPFINIYAMVNRLFSRAGYSLVSDFMSKEWFRSLFISGIYSSRDITAIKRRMDFLSERGTDVETTANYFGRVYASDSITINSVGNLTDCYLPQHTDSQGRLMNHCFSTNNTLALESDTLTYRPLSEIDVGFEYRLLYKSQYKLLSRTRLKAFDSVYLGTNANMRFEIANPYVDQRESLAAGISYRLIVFGYDSTTSYRLYSGDSVVVELSSDTALFTPTAEQCENLSLRRLDGNSWVEYDGDWVIYYGYQQIEGSVTIELCLRTSPERLSPSSPKKFNNIYFYGADAGMSFTLLSGTRITPYFSPHPGYGVKVGWEDITNHSISQSELLASLQHLFNLRIFTDEEQKRVYIEPEAEFYKSSPIFDLSSQQILGSDLKLLRSDIQEHEARRMGYIGGDGLVERFNATNDQEFSEWVATSDSMATLMGEERLINPLFSATINRKGDHPTAADASIPVVGNRDDVESVDKMQFTPRIVSYRGLKRLPEGQSWGYPAQQGVYPFAAFHFEGDESNEGFTLCFEDRDSVRGLNQYYTSREQRIWRSERVVVCLKLSAEQIVQLQHRQQEGRFGLDSLFRLTLNGEGVLCRLDAVEQYELSSGKARCRFTIV